MSQSRTNAIQAERQARIDKANLLREKGYEPYSAEVTRQMTLQHVRDNFDALKEKGTKVTLSGRIHSLRLSGKIGFTTMVDYSTGLQNGFQFLFKKDDMTGDLGFDDFKTLADRGDFIEATGVLELSQRGEPSLFVHEFKILTKSLRSFPEKLDDIEQKYRKRYIDMNLDPEVREMFVKKSKFWKATRDYMIENNFLEVYAPTMEHTTGGAEAAPFSTYHNALDEDYYLRISSELFLKRYIVGGYEKVFDLDKNFRNEGIDDEHLQEYYQMEFYWAYAEFDDLVNYTEGLIKHVIQETFGTLELTKDGEKVSWDGEWPRMDYYEFVEKFANIKLQEYDTVEKLRGLADKLGLKYEESDGYGRLVDLIYKKTARPKCVSPVWLINVPVELSPLAKRNPQDPSKTLRAQLIAYGSELTNGYAELNDPVDQLNRFEEQQSLREAGDDEAMMPDYDFVEALEYGMPPTVGFAYSERLFSVLYEKPIRETTAFPMVKKFKSEEDQRREEKERKKLKVAHAVLFVSEEDSTWVRMNTVAHLSASFAARGENLFHVNISQTADEVKMPMNIRHAIMIKSTSDMAKLRELYLGSLEDSQADAVIFTRDMLASTNDNKVHAAHQEKEFAKTDIMGVLLFGEKNHIEELTKEFELYG